MDSEVAALLLSFPWVVANDISVFGLDSIGMFGEMMEDHPDLAKEVLEYGWVHDDITPGEWRAIGSIRDIANNDLELAWHVIRSPFLETPFLQRDQYALERLWHWSLSGPPEGIVFSGGGVEIDADTRVESPDDDFYSQGSALLAQLASQSWFNDGIDDLDAALLHALNYETGGMKLSLVETAHVVSTTVHLPFSGTVGLAVVRHTPFPSDDHTLAAMERGLRVMEDFMGVGLPVNDVILLVVEPGNLGAKGTHIQWCGGRNNVDPCYLSAIIMVEDHGFGPPLNTIYHELAHHYLVTGSRWLVEGEANFLEAYVLAQTGGPQLDERLAYLESREGCLDNIWQHVNPYRGGQCDYVLGEKFMLGMHEALGPQAVSAAFRELYTQSFLQEPLNHDSIYYAFLSNAPPGKEEAFKTAYRRYHGGPIRQPGPDSPEFAPLMALYHATDGDNWLNNTNWGSDAPLGAWHGVYTNAKGQVTGLNLSKNGLTGHIPPELGDLPDLIGLILRENALTGEIPPELGRLTNLDQLKLAWNQLTGEIPSELGNLTALVQLSLGGNQLTGGIPAELGQLTSLRSLTLQGGNRLTGDIPPELGNLTNLEVLWLGGNLFSGCLASGMPEIWVEKTRLQRCGATS